MPTLIFPYLSFPKRNPKTREIIGETSFPFIPVRIIYQHRLYPNPINCLIDSGAEKNLFPAFFGERIGLKVKKGKQQDIRGIGGVKIKGFTHNVRFYVDTLVFETNVDFSYEQEVPLLGRIGFFDKFRRVTFKEKENIVELER